MRNLGYLLYLKGDYPQAAEMLELSFQILDQQRGLDYSRTQVTVRDLVALYEAWDRPEQATAYRALLPDTLMQ